MNGGQAIKSARWPAVCKKRGEHPPTALFFSFRKSRTMFGFYSSRLGCLGSLAVSILGSIILIVMLRSCAM
jgi:hypothetical protein